MDTENYIIHDNGCYPFNVVIKNNKVKVYNMNNKDLICEFITNKIFIGKSPFCSMIENSCDYGEAFDGNTILLHLEDNKYVYVGECIYSFKSFANITDYISSIGRNDVPYPYAVDSDNNYYLMIENIIIKSMQLCEDPYDVYYKLFKKNKNKNRIKQEIDVLPFEIELIQKRLYN